MVERRTIRRAAEEALEEAPTDPRLPIIVLPEELDDPARDDLPPGFGGASTHTNGHAPHPATAPAFTTLTFRPTPTPWYRTNAAKLALLGTGVAVALASLVVLLWPSSSPAPQDAGTTTAPAPSPSAAPSLTPSATPSPPPVGLPPAQLPPPPPPPAAEPASPPVYYPQYYPPSEQKKPQTNVTRAPISVSPTIKPKPDRNSSTPGDAPEGGWGW